MKTYGFSIQGKSHIARNIVCQDSSLAVQLKCGLYMGIVADGVGSARHADIGSKMAVEQLYRYCDSNVRRKQSETEIEAILKKGYQTAMRQIEKYVAKEHGKPEEYDTTLSAVIYDGNTVVYGHAGDGGIIARYTDGVTKPVTSRQKGVDGISVRPLRAGSSSWKFGIVKEPVASVLLVTDGMLDSVIQPFLINIPKSKEEALRGNIKKDDVYITATEFFMNPDVLYQNHSVKDPDRSMLDFLQGNESAGEEKILIDRMRAGYMKLFGKNGTDRLCNEIQKTCYLLSAMKTVDDDKSVVCLMNNRKKVIPKNASMYQEPDWKELYDRYMRLMQGEDSRPKPIEDLPPKDEKTGKGDGTNGEKGTRTSKRPSSSTAERKISPQMKEKLRRYRMNMRILLGIIVILTGATALTGLAAVIQTGKAKEAEGKQQETAQELRKVNSSLDETKKELRKVKSSLKETEKELRKVKSSLKETEKELQKAEEKSAGTSLPKPTGKNDTAKTEIEKRAVDVLWLLEQLQPDKLSREKAEALSQALKENQLDVIFWEQQNSQSPVETQQPDRQEKKKTIQTGVITDREYLTTESVSKSTIQTSDADVVGNKLLEILEEVKKEEKEKELKDELEQKYSELSKTKKGQNKRKKINNNVTKLLETNHTGE